MKLLKIIKNNYSKVKQSGQMLLFVLIVVLLLLIVVLAIVVNIRVDIEETQMEREYESGYSVAEEELFKIASEGYNLWISDCDDCDELTSTDEHFDLCSRNECESNDSDDFRCTIKSTEVDGVPTDVIIKECIMHKIEGISINQDETIEVVLDYNGQTASGVLDVSWEGAPAISAMLVCKDASGNYSNVRAAICSGNAPTCSMSGVEGFKSINEASVLGEPLNIDTCGGSTPVLLRLRAIGGDAMNITVEGDLPQQMASIRSQSFTNGVENAEGLSAPEVVTLDMLHKRLPALFDYVLYVADGDVRK